ncbi:hypothetical protein DICA0_A08878 [Diutina catenulata]
MSKNQNQSLSSLYSLATLGGSTTRLSTVGSKLDRISDSDDALDDLESMDEHEEDDDLPPVPAAFSPDQLIQVPAPDLVQQYYLPIDPKLHAQVKDHRNKLTRALHNPRSEPLMVVVGPQRIRDQYQAQECSRWIPTMAQEGVTVAMRANFSAKYNGTSASFELGHGLPSTRSMLFDMAARLPLVGQTSDLLSHHYFDDIFTSSTVSSSLAESQLHREIVSGISYPVGFACHDGDAPYSEITYTHKLQGCLDSMQAAHNPHHFLNITKRGQVAVLGTSGNDETFIVANIEHLCLAQIDAVLAKAGSRPVMVDVGQLGNAEYESKLAKMRHVLASGAHVVGVMVDSGEEYDLPTEYIENTPRFVAELAAL